MSRMTICNECRFYHLSRVSRVSRVSDHICTYPDVMRNALTGEVINKTRCQEKRGYAEPAPDCPDFVAIKTPIYADSLRQPKLPKPEEMTQGAIFAELIYVHGWTYHLLRHATVNVHLWIGTYHTLRKASSEAPDDFDRRALREARQAQQQRAANTRG